MILSEKVPHTFIFKASNGWFHKFKQHHGIYVLFIQCEKLSSDVQVSEEFVTMAAGFLLWGYTLNDIFNADEFGMFWKALPSRTSATEEEKFASGMKSLKDRITTMACANASGTIKIPLLIIGKTKKPRCFKNVKTLPVKYNAQESALMNREIFTDWFIKVFIPTARKHANRKILLPLDNAPAHPSKDLLNSIDPMIQALWSK